MSRHFDNPSPLRVAAVVFMLVALFITRWIKDEHKRFQIQLIIIAAHLVVALLAN